MLDRLIFANSIARSKHSLNIDKVQKRNLVSLKMHGEHNNGKL